VKKQTKQNKTKQNKSNKFKKKNKRMDFAIFAKGRVPIFANI